MPKNKLTTRTYPVNLQTREEGGIGTIFGRPMVGYIYEELPEMNYGVASAAALILFVIILIVTMINGWVSKKRVHF